MFTGIVERMGTLAELKPMAGGYRLRVETAMAEELRPGDSVAVAGVCLTALVADHAELHADVGPETARVTTLGALNRGALVNLERPLRADSRLGGHFVQGHVDGVGHVEDIRQEAEFYWLTVGFSQEMSPFLVHRGSVAVDGISLTVAGLGSDRFDVQIVPYTHQHTNLRAIQLRDRVNIECDMVGKYVVRAAELAGLSLGKRPGDITH